MCQETERKAGAGFLPLEWSEVLQVGESMLNVQGRQQVQRHTYTLPRVKTVQSYFYVILVSRTELDKY